MQFKGECPHWFSRGSNNNICIYIFGKTGFHRSPGTIDREPQQLCSSVGNQYASQILDLEQFVAEGTGNISSCEENSHSQWKSCAHPDKAQSPSDQRKNVIIEKPRFQSESCTFTQRRPSVIPREGLKPISKEAQTLLRHETHVGEWDGAVHWPKNDASNV